MAKVRFLQSAILIGHKQTYGYNDEAEINDNLAEKLAKNGIVDVLKEPVKAKPKKPAAKKAKEEPEEVVENDS